MPADQELLASYVRDRSQEAFSELVRRHLDLVYASARRQVGNEALAQDVTQAVFIMLATKAATLRSDVILPAWLLTATWYACKNAMRKEHRRRIHERGASLMRSETGDEAALPDPQIGRVLDEALMSLREPDRAAVVMHYLQGQTFNEVAAALQTTPEAARKRADRALEKLRMQFARQGMDLAAPAAVGPYLISAASTKAPAAVFAAVTSTASGGAAIGAHALANATLKTLAAYKAKVAACIVAASLMIAGAGITVATIARHSAGNVTSAAATAPATSAPLEALRRSGAAVNEGDGETFKSLVAITNPAERAFIDLVAENIGLAGLFKSAYRKAFGASAPEPLSAAWAWPTIPANTRVLITGDRASVLLNEGTVQMVKVDGQWKLTCSGISVENQGNWPASSPRTLELVRLDNLAYAETTDAIAQGRFTSPEQARTELRDRLARGKAAATTKATTHSTVEKSPTLQRPKHASDKTSNGS